MNSTKTEKTSDQDQENVLYHFGFIVEQALGHLTHSKNLQMAVPKDPSVQPEWGLIPWAVEGWTRHLPIYKNNWTVRSGLRARRILAEMQRRGPLDAVLFHTQVTAMLAPDWLDRVPSVVSLDATPSQYDQLGEFYGHLPGPRFIEEWKFQLAKRVFYKARHLITWSEWAKQSLIDDYQIAPEKVTVIPPGVDTQLWQRTRPFNTANRTVRALFVGGDLQRKGGLLLLEAFRRLRSEGLPLELHLVTRDSLQPETGLHVYHHVEPNSPELVDLYHQSDIFCLPTFGDCLAIVLCEAAAAGVPMISTRIAGIPEVVRDGETGLLISPGNLDELVNVLRQMILNTEMRQRMGSAAERLALQKLDAEQNGLRILEIMKSVTEEERAYRKIHPRPTHQARPLAAPLNDPPQGTRL